MIAKRFLKYAFLHIFCPLFIGALVYLFFRKGQSPLLDFGQKLMEQTGLLAFKNQLQTNCQLPDFILYQMVDALWAYAFCAIFLWIWKKQNTAFVAFITFLLCTFYEFLQKWQLTAGTFDNLDILAMLLGCCCAFLFTKKSII